jgi:predicted Zn-dependent protease
MRWLAVVGLLLGWVAFFFVFVSHDFTTCTGLTFDRAYTPVQVSAPRAGRVQFVPIEDYPEAVLKELAGHYQRRYGLDVAVAPAFEVPEAAIDERRQQLKSTVITQALQAQYPQPEGGRLIVIAFLEEDMYIPEVNWNYAISYRHADRYAVVSSARLTRGCLGLVEASDEQSRSRLRKMVTKNIGMLYFELPASEDPRSVLYGRIGGPQEFDRMSEEF